MSNHRHTIRNIDPDLILEARLLAIQSGTTLGELISEGLELVLAEAWEDGSEEIERDDPNEE